MQLNIPGFKNKLSLLEIDLKIESVDILLICEHGLSDDEITTVSFESYNLVSYFCRTMKQRGGVAIFAKKGIKIDKINIKSIESCFECAGAKMTVCDSSHLFFVSLYRPPDNHTKKLKIDGKIYDSNFEPFLEQLENVIQTLAKLCKNNENFYIGGDMNINLLQLNSTVNLYRDLVDSYNLNIVNNVPTRVTNTSATLIDHIITNNHSTDIDVVTLATNLSDHHYTILSLSLDHDFLNTVNSKKTVFTRNFNKENMEYFHRILLRENWFELMIPNINSETKWQFFLDIFYYHFNEAFPSKEKKLKSTLSDKPSWLLNYPQIVSESLYLKLFHKFVKENPSFEPNYKNALKKHKFNIAEAQRLDNDNFINNSDNKIKAAWKIINKRSNFKTKLDSNIPELLLNNITVSDPTDICNLFNDFFVKSVETMVRNYFPSNPLEFDFNNFKQIDINNFKFQQISHEKMLEYIHLLPNKNTSGPDEVTYRVVKFCGPLLAVPLAYLINQSICESIFPKQLKISKSFPLLKKGPKNNLNSYRSISSSSVFGKLFEGTLDDQLMQHRYSNDLISISQHGFLKNKSTITATYALRTPIYI